MQGALYQMSKAPHGVWSQCGIDIARISIPSMALKRLITNMQLATDTISYALVKKHVFVFNKHVKRNQLV